MWQKSWQHTSKCVDHWKVISLFREEPMNLKWFIIIFPRPNEARKHLICCLWTYFIICDEWWHVWHMWQKVGKALWPRKWYYIGGGHMWTMTKRVDIHGHRVFTLDYGKLTWSAQNFSLLIDCQNFDMG